MVKLAKNKKLFLLPVLLIFCLLLESASYAYIDIEKEDKGSEYGWRTILDASTDPVYTFSLGVFKYFNNTIYCLGFVQRRDNQKMYPLLLSSKDEGKTWDQKIFTDFIGGFDGMAYNGKTYVLSTYNKKGDPCLLTSQDGKDWKEINVVDTIRKGTGINTIDGGLGLACDGNRFLAVSCIYGSLESELVQCVLTSPDGQNWTVASKIVKTRGKYTEGFPDFMLDAVYLPDKKIYVAAAYSDSYSVMISSDGIKWKQVTVFKPDSEFNAESFRTGMLHVNAFYDMKWDYRTNTVYIIGCKKYTYNKDTNVVSGDSFIISSKDGINWKQENMSNNEINYIPRENLLYLNEHAFSCNEDCISIFDRIPEDYIPQYKYLDGEDKGKTIVVNRQGTPLNSKQLRWVNVDSKSVYTIKGKKYGVKFKMVIYDGKQFVASGFADAPYQPSLIMTSKDGLNWKKTWDNIDESYCLNAIRYVNGKYFILGSCGVIQSSKDAAKWSKVTLKDSPCFNDLIWANGKYIAVGGLMTGENGIIYTSADGVNWKKVLASQDSCFHRLCSNGKVTVAVGETGAIYYSADGTSWHSGSTDECKDSIRDAIWDGKAFRAVTNSGILLTSQDGIKWGVKYFSLLYGKGKEAHYSTGEFLDSIDFTNNRYVIAADNGLVLTSTDAVNWYMEIIDDGADLGTLASNGSRYLIADHDGHLLLGDINSVNSSKMILK